MNKIVVVIADEKYRSDVSRILIEGGYEVSSNSFVDNLPELIKSLDPSLLLLDGHMVEHFGPKLRQEYPQKPVIAWMNQRDAQLAIGFITAGALDCLHPPATFNEVLGVVRHVLNQTVAKEEPIPEPKKDYSTLIRRIIEGFVVLSLVTGYVLFDRYMSSQKKTFAVTYQNPTGVFWLKNRLWTSDWYTQSIYQYKVGKGLKLLKIYSFPEFNPNAVAVISDALWVTGTDGYIRTYTIVKNVPTITNTFKAPGYSPTGLCVQRQYLWSTDAETNKIYQHLLNDPDQVIGVYDYPGAMPVGLYWDGEFFWSADGKANKVYRHLGPEKRFEIVGTYALAPEGGGMIAGMGGDGHNLWLIYTSQPARILRYPLSKLKQ